MLAQLPCRRGFHAAWVPWMRGLLARLVASRAFLACAGALEVWSPCVRGCLGSVISLLARVCLGDVVLLSRLPWRRGLPARALALEAWFLALAVALEAWSPCARGCLGGVVSLLSLLPLQRDLFACPVAFGGGALREFVWDFLFHLIACPSPSLARLLPSACVEGVAAWVCGQISYVCLTVFFVVT